jgi:serine/threonine protein kinase
VHQDIAENNIVVNGVGGRAPGDVVAPYRSLFPWRCYLIDFEFAIQLPAGSTPEEIAVAAVPFDRYLRWLAAPEILGPTRYDPFSADVYQLGLILWETFHLYLTVSYFAAPRAYVSRPQRNI